MRTLLFILLIECLFLSSETTQNTIAKNQRQKSKVSCTNEGCKGRYKGPEFIDGDDVAHQFSNKMAKAVGDALKESYREGNYQKVDFANIQMSTKGMGSGRVTYALSIPFVQVNAKCDAYTSFDHVGGWNHAPALAKRKQELSSALMDGQELNISKLKTTPEGLQEYWIQWKNKITQAECN
jgi:hypothetical protein